MDVCAKTPLAEVFSSSPATAPKNIAATRGDGARKYTDAYLMWKQTSLCVVLDQPVGNPKRKV
jgi:hypothetical protein